MVVDVVVVDVVGGLSITFLLGSHDINPANRLTFFVTLAAGTIALLSVSFKVTFFLPGTNGLSPDLSSNLISFG